MEGYIWPFSHVLMADVFSEDGWNSQNSSSGGFSLTGKCMKGTFFLQKMHSVKINQGMVDVLCWNSK